LNSNQNETRKEVPSMHEPDGRPLRSYVFVTTEAGKTRTVVRGISDLEFPGCRILTVEPVIGEYDIIVKIEGQDIDSMARVAFYGIQEVSGVLDVVASCCVDESHAPQLKPSGRRAPDVVSVTHY